MFLAAVEWHRLRLRLPALLQHLYVIDTGTRLIRQGLRFGDECLATLETLGLGRFESLVGLGHGGFPLRLNVGKSLFAQMPCLAPAFRKRMQFANVELPVVIAGVGFSPGFELLNQGAALLAGGFTLLAHLLQPSLHPLVSGIASLVKRFPQCWAGRMGLVQSLPLFPQLTDGVLQFAACGLLRSLACIERLGFFDQLLTRSFNFRRGWQRGCTAGSRLYGCCRFCTRTACDPGC